MKFNLVEARRRALRLDATLVLGTSGKVFCPYHEDKHTPNMKVYRDHLHCYACGAHVTLFDYLYQVAIRKGESPVHARYHAMRRINTARNAGIWQPSVSEKETMPPLDVVRGWANRLLASPHALHYLRRRRLAVETSHAFMLGYNGLAIVIPHLSREGKVVGVKFRTLSGQSCLKYTSLRGSTYPQLYPAWRPVSGEYVLLVEGEFDCLVLRQAGLPALSVPSGVTSANKYIPELCALNRPVYVLFDMDAAGQQAARDLRGALPHVSVVQWPTEWGKDVSDVASQGKLGDLIRKVKENA